MNIFVARYQNKGIQQTVTFNKAEFDQPKAEAWLNSQGIQNFMFFFEPYEPEQFDENTTLFKGEVGFDITAENIMQHVNEGKNIVIDSFGGDLFEGWKIHDRIKLSEKTPSIGVIGMCASSAIQILMASDERWASENSRGLIHNPWTMAIGDVDNFKTEAATLERETNRLAQAYSEISGKPIDIALSVMKEERFMDANELLEWNFIKSIRTGKPITNNLNEEEMAENKELAEKVGVMEGILNRIVNLLTPSTPKNLMVTEATGKQIDFYEIEEESQIVVGVKARVEGVDAEGEYVMAAGMHEGKTFVFAKGELTEIKEPAEEETEALKTENEELKAQIETLKGVNANALKEMATLKTKVAEFSAMVTTGNPKPATPPAPDGKVGFSYKKKQ